MIPKLYTPVTLPGPLDMFGQLIAQAPFAIWVADAKGDVVLYNEAMKDLVGIDDPEKVLNHYNIFKDPIAKSQGLVPYIKKVLDGRIIQTVVMLDLSKEDFNDGENPKVYYVRAVYFPLRNHYGDTEYIVTVVQNITPDYLEDLALSKVAYDLQKKQRELLNREKLIIDLKVRTKALKKQLLKLKEEQA